MNIQQKQRPYKGAAATFLARQGSVPLETLSEFKSQPKQSPSAFHQQTNLFASMLLRLWTPKKEEEDRNFIPHYQPCPIEGFRRLTELDLPPSSAPFHHYSPMLIQHYFLVKDARNLGALSFLNALMCGSFQSRSLGIVNSPKTQTLYFTQKLSVFWFDFFNHSSEPQPLSHTFFDHKLQGFTQGDDQKSWWDDVLSNGELSQSPIIDLRDLFLNEMFETALRIYVTPLPLLQDMINRVLGQYALTGQFSLYFFNKIEQFKKDFIALLYIDEQIEWLDYIQEHGFDVFNRYAATLTRFSIMGKTYDSNYFFGLMLTHAASLKILNLIGYFSLDVITPLSFDNKAIIFDYLIKQADHDWDILVQNPACKVWDTLDELAKTLSTNTEWQRQTVGLCSLAIYCLPLILMKSIQFRKTNLAIFFLVQKPEWINWPIFQTSHLLLSDDQVWLDHSLLYLAQQLGNTVMANLLISGGAQLLESESEFVVEQKPMEQQIISPRRRRASFFVASDEVISTKGSIAPQSLF